MYENRSNERVSSRPAIAVAVREGGTFLYLIRVGWIDDLFILNMHWKNPEFSAKQDKKNIGLTLFSMYLVKTIHEIISFDKLVLSNNYELLPPGRVKFAPPKNFVAAV